MDAVTMSTPGASSSNAHLSYPTQTPRSPSPQPKPPRELHKNRLYVGNLHPTVDEYTFLQVFSKFGKVARLDYLFHKTGPSKGKPRGYAFVEYSDKDDANKALVNGHGKLLRGRKLVVTFAHQAPSSDAAGTVSARSKYRKGTSEATRPTALSLMKNNPHLGKTEDKIAALEAKLSQMQQSSQPSTLHPSLPHKPPSTRYLHAGSTADSSSRSGGRKAKSSGPKNDDGLGKKPTLEELMRNTQPSGINGLIKRS